MEGGHSEDVITFEQLEQSSNQLLARWVNQLSAPSATTSPYLAHGSALNALLLALHSEITGDYKHLEAAAAHLVHGVKLLESISFTAAFHQGITGLGWCVQNFPDAERIPWSMEFLGDLDELLTEGISNRNNLNVDLVNGLAGITVYALDRAPSCISSAKLWNSIDDQISFFLTQWNASLRSGLTVPKSWSNLGVAHGMPGVISVAAVALSRGYLRRTSPVLVRESLDRLWTLRTESERTNLPSFAYTIGGSSQARLAWCYGSLGLGAVFNNGARLHHDYSTYADALCRSALNQHSSDQHGIKDASLCHGEAGVALAFDYLARSRMADASLASELIGASRKACAAALALEVNNNGRPVILHHTPQGLLPSDSFLEGGGGVGLSLASIFLRRAPAWTSALSYY